MKRTLLLVSLLTLSILATSVRPASAATRLIPKTEAARHGLERAWFSQINIDPAKAKIEHLRLFPAAGRFPDTLFVQSDQGVVHALNAENGQTLWVRGVGNRSLPTMAVGANDDVVGVINGTHLYLLDRADGRILFENHIDGVPVQGPVLTDKFAFAPTLSGRVLGFPIEKDNKGDPEIDKLLANEPVLGSKKADSEEGESTSPEPNLPTAPVTVETPRPFALKQQATDPLQCVSFGVITTQPVFLFEEMKNQYLAWTTPKGLFVSYVDLQRTREFPVRYQLDPGSEIVTQPTYLPRIPGSDYIEGLVFSATKSGQVYAILATRGTEAWNYAIGQPIVQPIAPIGDHLYVVTQLGKLFCLDAASGNQLWSTTGVAQFVAASKDRVYVADRFGQLRMLDPATGVTVDGLFAADQPIKFRNLSTDRIYLATPSGLVQCLHETTQTTPFRHQALGAEQPKVGDMAPGAEPKSPEKSDDEESGSEEKSPFDNSTDDEPSPFE